MSILARVPVFLIIKIDIRKIVVLFREVNFCGLLSFQQGWEQVDNSVYDLPAPRYRKNRKTNIYFISDIYVKT